MNGPSFSYRSLRQSLLPLRPEAFLGTNLQVKFPSQGFPKDISPPSTSLGPSLSPFVTVLCILHFKGFHMKGLGYPRPPSGIIIWLGIDSRIGIWVLFGEVFPSFFGGLRGGGRPGSKR